MANYKVTGVWKDELKRITHLLVHLQGQNGWLLGQRKTEAEAIKMIESGDVLTTLRWDYKKAVWQPGAKCIVVKEATGKYIRTVPDASVEDNLDNLIFLQNIA